MGLPSYADVVEKVKNSVVALRGTRFPASGTVIDAHHVVTVAHVMGRGSEGKVALDDGREVRAVLKGLDRRADLAVVFVEADLAVPDLTGDAHVRTGDVVLALGRPTGLLRASVGLVAAVSGPWRTPRGVALDRFVDVDGALPPGFSGGPLVRGDGEIVGINTALVVRGGTTLAASTVRRMAQALIAGESTKPGFLGAAVQVARLSEEQRAAVSRDALLLVTSLTRGGPAEQAGVQAGDLLVSLDGEALTDVASLLAALGARGGDTVKLVVLRGGEQRALDVALGVPPSSSRG